MNVRHQTNTTTDGDHWARGRRIRWTLSWAKGDTIETARANLQEAIELVFETADPSEIERRRHSEVFVTRS